jgi:hypothetical protein
MSDPVPSSEEFEFTLDGRTVRSHKGEMLIAAAERAAAISTPSRGSASSTATS